MDEQTLLEKDTEAAEAYARSKRRVDALTSLSSFAHAKQPPLSRPLNGVGGGGGSKKTGSSGHGVVVESREREREGRRYDFGASDASSIGELTVPVTFEDAERNNQQFLFALDRLTDQIEQINDSFNNYFVLRLHSSSIDEADTLLM